MSEEKPTDVGVCNLTSPPIIVPLTERALERMPLPEGANGIIFPYDEAQDVIKVFEEEYTFKNLGVMDYTPTMISVGNLQAFH